MIAFMTNPGDARFHDAFTVVVPPLSGKEALLLELSSRLRFPLRFGMNWDALNDILGDPYWIEARRVVIVHSACPQLTREELAIYLGILRSTMRPLPDAKTRPHEELDAFFPLDSYETVMTALNNSTDRDGVRGFITEEPPSRTS